MLACHPVKQAGRGSTIRPSPQRPRSTSPAESLTSMIPRICLSNHHQPIERGMARSIAIVQSNYIPWKGYFDMINQVQEFVLYDDMQYTRRDWRNRNRIKTADGIQWLTIPVEVKGKYLQKIKDTVVSDPAWAGEHWSRLSHAYGKAPYFRHYRDAIEGLYRGTSSRFLSEINHHFLTGLCRLMGIQTRLTWSSAYQLAEERNERLAGICAQAGADEYLSGPAARDYMDESLFAGRGIRVRWMDYSGYPEYPQLHPPFDHAVTVLDLLFSVGPDFGKYLKTFSAAAVPAS
jgi:hypothetical protein